MTDSDDLKPFLADYERYVREVLRPTQDRLKATFERWKTPDYWTHHLDRPRPALPSPIQRAFTRIKRPESVVDKILRKSDSFPDGMSVTSVCRMRDALGGRVIVHFLATMTLVDREIRTNPAFELCSDDSPIAYLDERVFASLGLPKQLNRGEKESGYASIHYILRIKDETVPEEKNPFFELQVRTLAEDMWGEIEHILGYKPGKRTGVSVRKQFQLISQLLSTIDQHFSFLYDEQTRYQSEKGGTDADPLNPENLPAVLREVGVILAASVKSTGYSSCSPAGE